MGVHGRLSSLGHSTEASRPRGDSASCKEDDSLPVYLRSSAYASQQGRDRLVTHGRPLQRDDTARAATGGSAGEGGVTPPPPPRTSRQARGPSAKRAPKPHRRSSLGRLTTARGRPMVGRPFSREAEAGAGPTKRDRH